MPRVPAAPKPLSKIATYTPISRPVTKPLVKKRGKRALVPITEAREGHDTSTYAGAELVDQNKPLTQKQKDFVRAWASGESILSASTRAGYADGGTFAYRMVRMPNILRLYNEEKAAYEAAAGMTRKKVMDGLLEGVEMAKMAGEPASVIAGWREIGKMCGYYEPVRRKLDITVNGSVVMDRMNRMSDAELLRVIQGEVLELEE